MVIVGVELAGEQDREHVVGVIGEAGEKGLGRLHVGLAQNPFLGGVTVDEGDLFGGEKAAGVLFLFHYHERDLALLEDLGHRASHPAVAAHHDVVFELLQHFLVPS